MLPEINLIVGHVGERLSDAGLDAAGLGLSKQLATCTSDDDKMISYTWDTADPQALGWLSHLMPSGLASVMLKHDM
jgi:hypothetical protein